MSLTLMEEVGIRRVSRRRGRGIPNRFDSSGRLSQWDINENLGADLDPDFEGELIFYDPPFKSVPENLPEPCVFGLSEDGKSGSTIQSERQCLHLIRELEEILKIDPSNDIVLNELGLVNLGLGDISMDKRYRERAVDCFKRAFILDRGVSEYFNNISMAHYRLGNLKEAFFFQERALELDPVSFHANLNMGFLYFAIGNYRIAEKFFDESITLEPRCAMPHYYKAIICARKKDWGGAYKQATECINLEPDNAEHWYHRALSSEANGDYEAAIDDLKQALEIDPENLGFKVRLAGNYWYLKDFESSKIRLRVVLDLVEATPLESRNARHYQAAILAKNGLERMGEPVEKNYRREARKMGFQIK